MRHITDSSRNLQGIHLSSGAPALSAHVSSIPQSGGIYCHQEQHKARSYDSPGLAVFSGGDPHEQEGFTIYALCYHGTT